MSIRSGITKKLVPDVPLLGSGAWLLC